MTSIHFLAILAALFVADTLTTIYILKRGGVELNPVVAGLIGRFGRDRALVGVKVALLAALWYFQAELEPFMWTWWVLVAMYVFVVLNNLRALRSQR